METQLQIQKLRLECDAERKHSRLLKQSIMNIIAQLKAWRIRQAASMSDQEIVVGSTAPTTSIAASVQPQAFTVPPTTVSQMCMSLGLERLVIAVEKQDIRCGIACGAIRESQMRAFTTGILSQTILYSSAVMLLQAECSPR
jgi:hypothetical protein